ncbi:MAG: DNA topoisomerase I [Gammaproteobacteria bacterium]|jgi:DNA topoisomerase-1|nr:DNA topoisomerase I [Gammaproteobacteria bacterium]
MAKNLVVVESPAKARTIKKYLGPGYEVLASYGHVRDLRPKEGAVEPDNDFAMHYEPIERNEKHVAALARAMKKADALYLATDPDREGEAIAWHVAELLKEKKLLNGKPVHRIAFHEITKRAVAEAVNSPRELSTSLINAQQARRALDYLVGFNLSPLLWKKIRRGLSAGRVQSPALRMIAEREDEIEAFKAREYWTLEADVHKDEAPFVAKLTHYEQEKLTQFSITDESRAKHVETDLTGRAAGSLRVVKVEKKQRKRNPAAPFTTSTMQQEAARRLGFTAQRTMRTAQQLYEGVDTGEGHVGLITYMRTDSVTLAGEALQELRDFIASEYGQDQLPSEVHTYKTKAKNAQEAHEAVRPTGVQRTPDSIKDSLNEDQLKLYRLIWRRAVACQMIHATIDMVAADLACSEDDDSAIFRATGSSIANAGFLQVYDEDSDDDKDRRLPILVEGEAVALAGIRSEQHFTEPPPRYTEASLIRTLEEYGIGRPSTYATIISTLLAREYVELESRRFRPTDVGRLVNSFLTKHFADYVDYDFTARLEDDLDAISRGEKEWVPRMREFWEPFHRQVEDKDANVSRKEASQARVLGVDPESGRELAVRMGRYGPYAQIGTAEEDEKPRFAGLRRDQRLDTITMDEALYLFTLPRDLGVDEDGLPVVANIGRFGPYVRYGDKFVSLKKEDDPYTVGLDRALELIAEKKRFDAEREIQVFEEEGIKVLNGRYGPYVTNGERNARVPKDREPKSLSLEECKELLAAAPPRRGGRKAGANKKKAAAAKSTTKKTAKKKTKKKAKKKAKRKAKKKAKKKLGKKAEKKTAEKAAAKSGSAQSGRGTIELGTDSDAA